MNYSRARHLGLLIGRIGLHRVLEIEQRDPQLYSIRLLDKTVKSPDFYDLIVFNALISYRLRITGEAYWDLFANSVKEGEACETIIEFLKKHRALGINGKIRRLMALKGAGFRVSANLDAYKHDPYILLTDLSKVLNSDRTAKTLIFAVKMFYYAVMVREKERIRLDMKLPVPVDSRLIRITRSLGLVSDVHRPKAMEIQRAWGVISRIAGIPPLNIDSLLWPYKGGDILEYLEGLAKA